MASQLQIRILGPLTLERDGAPLPDTVWRSRQERRLLAILLARRGRRTSSEQLAEWLWPGAEPAAVMLTLRSAVSSLRRTLEPHPAARASSRYIVTTAGGYAWSGAADAWVDADAFLTLTEPPRDDSRPRAAALEEALALYRGDLLEDEHDAAWALAARERLRDRLVQAAQILARHHAERGDLAAALAAIRRALTFAPLCEPLWRQLMETQLLAGDAAGALQSYERYRQALDHELAAMPSAQTQALHAAILRGELPLAPTRPTAAAPAAPENAPAAAPLVGRERELTLLAEQFARLSAGRGGCVALVGEAGIGKSRLAAEALRRAAAPRSTIVLRCAPLEREMPFAALGEPLRRLVRAAPDVLLAELPPSSLAQVADLLPALRDRLPGLPQPAPLPPAERRNQQLDALAELALLLARLAPLVVLCDDAHWADEATLALVGRLALRAPRRPVLIILAYRSDELAENPPLHALLRDLGRQMLLTPLVLGRLDDAASARLVAELGRVAPGEVAALAERLAADTGGNPLFLTVAVQSILEQHGADSLAAALPAIAAGAPLPDPGGAQPVRDLVLGRLERLAAPARDLAEQLAVIGRPASLDLVEQMAGAEGLSAAEALLERQLLAEEADGRVSFAHDLVRSVVADALPSPRRRLLHRAAALALAALHGADPDRAAEIAHHLALAGRGVDQELLRYATAAGDHARRGRAYGAALAHYDAALAAAERLAGAAAAEEVRRAFAGRLLTCESLLDWDGVAAVSARYGRWAAARPGAPAQLVATRRLVLLRALTGDLAGAAELSRQQAAASGQQPAALADMLRRTALILRPPAEPPAEPGEAPPFEPAEPPPGDPAAELPALLGEEEAAGALFQVGWAALMQGLLRDARPCLLRSYALAEATGQAAGAVAAALQLAHLGGLAGDRAAEEQWLARSLEAAAAAPEAAWLSVWPRIHQGFRWVQLDQHALALARFEEMAAQLASLPSFESHRASVEVGIALAAMRLGDTARAGRALGAALERPGALYGFVYAAALHGTARLHAGRGDLAAARGALDMALRYCAERGLLPEYARTAVEAARLERDHGDPSRSAGLLRAAAAHAERAGLAPLHAKAAALLAGIGG